VSIPGHSSFGAPRIPPCNLCYNTHVNPWHSTEHCPYKHPTHILSKDIHECIMQYNAVHGAEKQGFTKTQDP
jgi:hypothetical protein